MITAGLKQAPRQTARPSSAPLAKRGVRTNGRRPISDPTGSRFSGAATREARRRPRHRRTIAITASSKSWRRSASMPSPRSMPKTSPTRCASSFWRSTACWCGSIRSMQGKTRAMLDAMLRDVAARGPWVSAHPDVILKMGVKEVLYRTKHLGWGTDTHLYRTAAEFAPRSRRGCDRPARASSSRTGAMAARASGRSNWSRAGRHGERRARPACAPRQHARGDCRLREFMTRCEAYFAADGCIVDQPFQPRLPDGMIRCYMGADKVVGFGHQFIKALIPPPPEGPDLPAAQPGPRIMHGADAAPFQALRAKMETEWTPQMMQVLGIDARRCRSSGTPTFSMDRAPRRAKTPTSCARSTSARSSRSRTRRRPPSRASRRSAATRPNIMTR